MKLSRRDMFGRVSLRVAACATLQRGLLAQSADPEYVEVKTAYGDLRGAKTANLTTFQGIPYNTNARDDGDRRGVQSGERSVQSGTKL